MALSIQKIHQQYSEGKLLPSELVKELLTKISASKLNSFTSVCSDRATKQAAIADDVLKKTKKIPDGQPLFGIPLGIKDVLAVEGTKTTCGSKILANYIAPYTATCVERLESAGAITIGKLNMDEFAMGSSNENSAFGPVLHPTHPDRVPGGSSGGSAAAVKAGLCVASLGTDTGGSIRLPASFCGVYGMKPTYGRVSRYGLVAYASSLDQAGPMANSLEDLALVLDQMSGSDPRDSTMAPEPPTTFLKSLKSFDSVKGLRVGLPKEYFIGGLDPAVEKSVQEAITWLSSQGAKLVEVSLPRTKYAIAAYYVIAVSEASSNLARFDGVRYTTRPKEADSAKDLSEFYEISRSLFGAEVKRRIVLGTFALSSGYYDAYYRRACQVRRLIQQDFVEAFQKADVVLSPVAPSTAFKLGEKTADPLQMYLVDIFTIPVNLAGLPAMSVPCGKDQHGLPIGLHLIGPAFGEAKLFQAAKSWSQHYEGEKHGV